MKKVFLAADHAGFNLKEDVKQVLAARGVEVVDLGTSSAATPVSYVTQGIDLGKKVVASQGAAIGIGFCGTGLGISMAVNKVKGARGARIVSEEDAVLAKKHNNANVILMGGRQLTKEVALQLVDAFDNTQFEGGRHEARVHQLDALE